MVDLNFDALLGSPQVKRWHKASELKKLKGNDLPFDIPYPLEVWNYDPCHRHEKPQADCQWHECGGHPYRHQKITASYSYVARRSIVGNSTGTGKSLSALLTLALEHHYGTKVKALIVVPTISVKQWTAETKRWTPGFNIMSVPAGTPKQQRLHTYADNWDILIIGYHVATKDAEHLDAVDISQVVVDDVDPSLSVSNKTYRALEMLCRDADLVIDQNATSLQVRLQQLYAASCLIGAKPIWGSEKNFSSNYVQRDLVTVKIGQGKKKRVYQATGYKNLTDFKRKFEPMFIQFTYDDIANDVTIPSLVTEQVYLDMSPKQRSRYTELQEGVRTLLNKDDLPVQQKAIGALAAFTIGSQICAGTFALKNTDGGYEKDGPEASPKLDWIMDKLTGEWINEKVVVYAKFRGSIMALQDRLKSEGISSSTIWGVETDANVRQAEIERFWQDPDTRVMIISVSGERSLNLQNASILVMWDMQLNPARVTQIAGRVRRVGSKHKRVFVFELLHNNSQEDRYMAALASRQALYDHVFDVESEGEDNLLIQKLDPEELLRLIRP